MKSERSNASTERILALLVLLLQSEHSREEIFKRIAAYERGAEPASRAKMLDRDLSTLERAGIRVERNAGCYAVPIEQFYPRSDPAHEQMYPTALSAGILVRIPR